MIRWLRHPLFAPVLVVTALAWGTGLVVFLLIGPALGGWARQVLAVCFGWSSATRAYRLDAVLLATLEPPLFVLVVGLFYADEMRTFLRRAGGRLVGGVAALAFVAAVVVLLATGDVVGGAPAATPPAAVRDSRAAPRARLVDHRGRAFELGAPSGGPVALTFVYTNCHATCPTLVATLNAVAARVGERATFVAVTLDPERDTPETLADYARRWDLGPMWRLATGAARDLARLRADYGVRAEELPGGDIAHDNVIVVLDRQGRVAYTYRGLTETVDDLAAVVSRLAAEPA